MSQEQNNFESLLLFIKRRKDDCKKQLRQYTGFNRSPLEKFMAGLCRKEIAVYDDVANWAKYFLQITVAEQAKESSK